MKTIYRVTIESPYSDELYQSEFFDTEESANEYANELISDFELNTPEVGKRIVLARYAAKRNSFSFQEEVASWEF